jgi:hypothetical protein
MFLPGGSPDFVAAGCDSGWKYFGLVAVKSEDLANQIADVLAAFFVKHQD